MYSTKRFLSSSLPKQLQLQTRNHSHHLHKMMVLPPRSNWDTIQAASHAIYNLLFYPSYRDTFLQNVNNNIINPNVLGQLEFGFFMSLALHHNLSSFHDGDVRRRIHDNNNDNNDNSGNDSNDSGRVNYFAKYNFDPLEFIDGSSLAVEQFQECLYSVDRTLISMIECEIRKDSIDIGSSTSSAINNDHDKDENDHHKATGDCDEPEQKRQMIERIVNQQMDKLRERSAATADADADASADINADADANENTKEENGDPNDHKYSDEYLLQQMTSKQLLDAIQKQFVSSVIDCYTDGRMRMNYTLDSGKVLNVALMSARAHEVPPEEKDEGEKEQDSNIASRVEDKDEPMMDDSFIDDQEGENYPVIAQLEVLYTISQSFTKKKIGGCSSENDIDSVVDDDDDNHQEHTMETAWVGVFEGWLDNSHQPLRWKLVDNRPAWEFPMMRR